MPRPLSILATAALVMLALPATQAVDAQQKKSRGTADDTFRGTLKLRRPAWFGFAVDCSDCAGAGASDTARRPLVITRVAADAPAKRGGPLQVGDTILSVRGREVSARELRAMLESATPDAPLSFVVGTARGRYTYSIRPGWAPIIMLGKDTLPVRYRGEYAEVTVDVFTNSAPVVTRDSTGAMIIRVGDHVIRLQR